MPNPKNKPTTPVKKSVAVNKKKPDTTVPAVKTKKKENHLILDLSPKAKKAKKILTEKKDVLIVETKKPELVNNFVQPEINSADILQSIAESKNEEIEFNKKEPEIFVSPGVFVVETDECGCSSCSCTPEHGTTQTMSLEPDSIIFKDELADIVDQEELPDDEYENLGDIEIEPSFDTEYVRNKYGNYVVFFMLLFLGLILYVGTSKPQTQLIKNPVTITVTDTIHDTDTITVVKEDTLKIPSGLLLKEVDSLKKANNKLTFERDTLLIALSKYAQPIYVKGKRK